MKPLRFSSNNYCQHKGEHSWSFTGSLIGILGQNGAGKSNLLKGLHAALTGDFDRPLDRTLTFGERQGYIEFEAEFAPGVVGTVRRSLHKNQAVLSFAGNVEPEIKGAKAVNAKILELIGTDKTLLSELIFVPQEQLARLLFTSPVENSRLASKFFGLDKAVDIEKSLAESIAQVQILPVPGDPTVLRAELDTLREAVVADTLAIDQAPDPLVLRAEAETLQRQIAAANETRAALLQRERTLLRREEAQTRHTTLTAERDALELQIARIPVGELRERYVRESEKRRLHGERTAAQLRRDRLKGERDSLVLNFGLRPTLSDALRASSQAVIDKLKTLEAGDEMIRQHQNDLLRRTEEADGVPCPVCLKPNHWVETEIQPILDDQARPRANEEDREEMVRLEKLLSDDAATRAHREQKIRSLDDSLARAQAEIDALGQDAGAGEPERWNDAIRAYDELRERLSRLNAELQRLEQSEGFQTPAETPEGDADGFDPVDAAAAQTRLAEINELLSRDTALRHARERHVDARDAKARELAAAESVVAQNGNASRRRETLRRMRASFHPDGAPAELIGRRVARMEPRINEYLSALRMPFRARASGGFNFEYQFDDSPEYPRLAGELSGGQRTATSVAFRLAALSSFGASAGLLVLDEASQALDEERIELFGQMLASLKPLAVQLGVTLVFVTHEPSLGQYFDQTINL